MSYGRLHKILRPRLHAICSVTQAFPTRRQAHEDCAMLAERESVGGLRF